MVNLISLLVEELKKEHEDISEEELYYSVGSYIYWLNQDSIQGKNIRGNIDIFKYFLGFTLLNCL